MKVYRRYLKIEPLHTEEYIAYLKGKVRLGVTSAFKEFSLHGQNVKAPSSFAIVNATLPLAFSPLHLPQAHFGFTFNPCNIGSADLNANILHVEQSI